jgi:hypothetical protein
MPLSDLKPATIDSWHSSGIVPLVGSYVSVFPPTNLPSGWDITASLWKRILTETDLNFFRDGEPAAGIPKDLSEIPFEAVMQCYPERTEIRPIIQEMFGVTAPNAVHSRDQVFAQSKIQKWSSAKWRHC